MTEDANASFERVKELEREHDLKDPVVQAQLKALLGHQKKVEEQVARETAEFKKRQKHNDLATATVVGGADNEDAAATTAAGKKEAKKSAGDKPWEKTAE